MFSHFGYSKLTLAFFCGHKWPRQMIAKLNGLIRNFIWTGSIASRKLITVPWSVCRHSRNEGGLGLKELSNLNKEQCWAHWLGVFLHGKLLLSAC